MNVVFTGGGSGGHVLPAMTLIAAKPAAVEKILYLGSRTGIEKEIAARAGVEYHAIPTGKLRRYFSFKNFADFFGFLGGIITAFIRLRKLDRAKTLVFSTGGFVALPVMIAARALKIPAFLHEQTSRAGLANRLSAAFAGKIFISFQSSRRFYPSGKTIFSGYPVRSEFLSAEKTELQIGGRKCDTGNRSVVLVTGGGNGSRLLNEWVAKASTHPAFERHFWIHQTGPQWTAPDALKRKANYLPTAFIGSELPNVMKCASLVVCRAGAGTLCELRALGKPALVVPLKIAQQNEQWHNAVEIQKFIPLKIIAEDDIANLSLTETVSVLEREVVQFSRPKELQTPRAEAVIWDAILGECRS